MHRLRVRCVTDYLINDARKHDPDSSAALEQLGLRLCDQEPYLRTPRLWQLIAEDLPSCRQLIGDTVRGAVVRQQQYVVEAPSRRRSA